jgi:hypothetical protein
MIGAAAMNVRRSGEITRRRKSEQVIARIEHGPTPERLLKADGHVSIGDDQRGTRVYHFHDCPLDRLYTRLTRQARSLSAETQIRAEYIALTKYRHHWRSSGLEGALQSADLDRVFASDPAGSSHMAKTERQAHHRQQYRNAVEKLGWKPHIVVDNVVCAETSLEVAGYSIGCNSRTSARDKAEEILRDCGRKLAKLWGVG